MAHLDPIDAIVLVVYLAGVVLLGAWLGRGRQDAKRYLLGGNNTPWWAILGSIVATETSTVTFLSVPGIAFASGGDLRFLQLAIGYIVGRSLIVIWLLPQYFRGELFTVYALLQDRFGASTQKLASLIFLVTRNLGDGLRLFLTALILKVTLGWSLPACVIAIGIATIIFTFFGGMQSVIWNDCLQLVVYMVGGLVALLLIASRIDGGMGGVWEFAETTGRLRMLDFPIIDERGLRFGEKYTFWAGLVGGAFLTLGTHGTDQMMVQRALAARSQADAGRALIASGFAVFLQFAMFLLVGIALAAFYTAHPPKAEFESNDQVFSTFIVTEMPQGIGLIGFLLAAVFSAAMSTLSSSLNSSATSVVADWFQPTWPNMSDERVVQLSRAMTVCFGVTQIAIGIWAETWGEAVITNALAIAGFSAGLLLGLFALGLILPNANEASALVGLAGGLCVLLLVKFVLGSPDSSWSYPIAWPWLPVIGSVTTFAFGGLASAYTTLEPPSKV